MEASLAGGYRFNKMATVAAYDYSLFVFPWPSLEGITAVTVSLNADLMGSVDAGELLESTGEIVHETGNLIRVRGKISSGPRILVNISGVLKKMRRRERPKE